MTKMTGYNAGKRPLKAVATLIDIMLLVLLLGSALHAQESKPGAAAEAIVPRLVNYAGKAVDGEGKAVAGTIGLSFAIYKDQSEGAPLWMETQNVSADAKGNYSVQLGAGKGDGLPLDLFSSGEARWLGVRVNGGSEQPRVLLLSVPYALKAADAQTLGGLPPSAFLLARPSAPGNASSASADSASLPAAVTGTGTTNFLPIWTNATGGLGNSTVFETGGKVGIGTITPAATLDVKGSAIVRGLFNIPAIGAATAAAGKNSQPFSITASAFNSTTAASVNENFRWQAEPVGNNTASPSAKLNLLFGAGGGGALETGLSISNRGVITFASGQTFPGGTGGGGTVKSVSLAAPVSDFTVTGSPITTSGTLGLQWLVTPTALDTPNSIVKRDASGDVDLNGLSVEDSLTVKNTIAAGRIVVQPNGIIGTATGNNAVGVIGNAPTTGNGSSQGVLGFSSTSNGAGVLGHSEGSNGAGLAGENTMGGYGVYAKALGTAGQGVYGESLGTQVASDGFGPDGVDGVSHSSIGSGVGAVNTSDGDGLFAQSKFGFAAFFLGDVDVDGTLSKAGGSFKIDHPLDPSNKYLYHSFVESPDMMNIYNGMTTLDAAGTATVQLPEWFSALNGEYRYQLTAIGAPGPNLYVAEEISKNQFKIAGGKSGAKVSWQVTGVRHDVWANAHRIPVEQPKPEKERGKYLHPELFGAPADKSIVAARHPGALKMMQEKQAGEASSIK